MVMFSHRSGSSNDRVETSAEKGRKFIDYATKLGKFNSYFLTITNLIIFQFICSFLLILNFP